MMHAMSPTIPNWKSFIWTERCGKALICLVTPSSWWVGKRKYVWLRNLIIWELSINKDRKKVISLRISEKVAEKFSGPKIVLCRDYTLVALNTTTCRRWYETTAELTLYKLSGNKKGKEI
ncbi:hypothetical protein AMTRI_Chr02g220210 [Amborella trichopoda]